MVYVVVDEQTGEYRLLRGLAKMRELDLRLARATQRARELVRKARETAEDTERAPEALDMDVSRNTCSTSRAACNSVHILVWAH